MVETVGGSDTIHIERREPMLDQLHFLSTAYLVTEWGVRLLMLFWVPTRRSPEAAKGWLLLIFFLPGRV